MRLVIGACGRLKDGPERQIFDRYADRITPIGRTLGIGPFSSFELSESKSRSSAERKSSEAQGLLAKVPEGCVVIALDEKGKSFTTKELANYIQRERENGRGGLTFLIGGPDGHGGDVLDKACLKLSLSAMTLPHGLARIVLAEQLYRALTVLAGHPYHRV